MRTVGDTSQFTPFGLWLRHYCRESTGPNGGLCITNLDYVLEDFKNRKLMLLEEKQSGGVMHNGQRLTFKILDKAIRAAIKDSTCENPYEYWGFYVIQFPKDKVLPCPGTTLNGHSITSEQLVAHLNFEKQFCEPMQFRP